MLSTSRHRALHSTGSRIALSAIASLGAVALLAGCAAGSSTSSSRSTSLVIAENEVPATFDPVQADNSTVDEVVIPAYDTLLTYDEAGTSLAPELATDWSVSDDGLTVTLTLRDDVTFHDGAELTAADVVYSLDRIQSIGIGVASFLTAYDSAEATGDNEVTITLRQPDATFLAALTRVYVVNSALVEENAGDDEGQSWLATNDAGSGPYSLTGYTSNQAASFEKYDDYWGGFDGQAETVQFQYLTEASTQKSALESGDIDIAMDIAPADWASFEGEDGFVVDSSDTNVALYAFFNMNDPVTSNEALREAVSYAYDYQQHVDTILLGQGNVMTGVLPSTMQFATTDGVTVPTFDLDEAKRIVDENDLAGTTVNMTYLEATTEMERAATLLQSNLAEIGITLTLQAITYPQYVDLESSDDTRPQMSLIYAFPAFPDASAILYQNFNSAFIGGGQNWGAYSNPEVDALTEQAQTSTDDAARAADYAQVQQIVTGDYATVNIANSKTVAVMADRVQGYTYRPWHHQTVDVYAITLAD